MSQRYLLRADQYPAQQIEWLLWDTSDGKALDTGTVSVEQLNHLTEKTADQPVVFIIPGEQVRSIKASFPGKARDLPASLPYLIEESISTPIEEMHLAQGSLKSGQIDCATVEHSVMQYWVQLFEQHKLNVQYCFADHQLLATNTDQPCVWQIGSRVLSATKTLQAAVSYTTFTALSSKLVMEEGQAYYSDTLSTETPLPQAVPQNQTLLEALANNWSRSHHSINLLQGNYQQESKVQHYLQAFKWPLIAALVLSAIGMSSLWLENYRLGQQVTAFDNAMIQLYKDTFPETRKVRNPVRQMRGQLNQLSGTSGTSSLPVLLSEAAPILKQHSAQILNLRFADNALRIQITAPDFNRMEQLEAKLNANNLSATLGTLTKNQNRVSGLLTIKGK